MVSRNWWTNASPNATYSSRCTPCHVSYRSRRLTCLAETAATPTTIAAAPIPSREAGTPASAMNVFVIAASSSRA